MDLQTFIALNKLYADYAATIDAEDWDGWTEYFVDDCEYKVQPRENFERGFPLATMWFISKGMLKDRAFGEIQSEANYAVFRTKLNGESTVFNVGRYIDRIVQTDEGLKFKSRFCIYDSEMIANSLIYPV